MTVQWRAYQEEAAEFFRSLGCCADVEKDIEGARGTHRVDVLAQTSIGGLSIVWVVECKLWKTAVSKEKVLALAQIVSDVGADRAFLLSESGFQAGAIRAAQNTNITLTSLQDLFDSAQEEIQKRQLTMLRQEALRLQRQLHDFYLLADGPGKASAALDREVISDMLALVFEIHTIAIPNVESGKLPVQMSSGSLPATLPDSAAFAAHARRELSYVENWISTAAQALIA